jgi:hypothetical protein
MRQEETLDGDALRAELGIVDTGPQDGELVGGLVEGSNVTTGNVTTANIIGIQPMSEAAFQAEVVRLAKALGWLVFSTWDSRHSPAGEPDLRLVRDRVIWAELKSEKGKPTVLQKAALEALADAGAEAYLWRPSNMDEIIRVLGRDGP